MKAIPKVAGWMFAVAAALPAAAVAAPCYTVIDRNDATVYRATDPPFALAGPEYDAGMRRLRAAGQQLFWFEPPAVCFEERGTPSGAPEGIGADASQIIQARAGLPSPGASAGGGGAPGDGGVRAASASRGASPGRTTPATRATPAASRPSGKY